MNEEQITRAKSFLKEIHGFTDTQINKYFSTDESLSTAIENEKAKQSESYDTGLEDGEKKVSNAFVTALKKDLGISVSSKELAKLSEIGKVLMPKFEEKYKNADIPTESEALKTLQNKYDAMVIDKDKEVIEAQTSSRREVEELRRDSTAKDILSRGGFNVPIDSEEFKVKLDSVKYMIEKRGFKYESDKNGVDVRMNEDGTTVRIGNKNATFEDDFKGIAGIIFGKTPADGKDGGIDKGTGSDLVDGKSTKVFDWSGIKTQGFKVPTTKDEAQLSYADPLIPTNEKLIIREYLHQEA